MERVRREGARGETTPNERKRPRRGAVVAGIGGALGVVAILLLVTPLTAAATPIASFSAPYTGAKAVQVRDPVSQGCNQKLSVATDAAFNLTSGRAIGKASASAGPCASQDAQASYDGTAGLRGLSFVAHTAGTYTVTASWSITWSGSASMTGAAANAGAQATVEMVLVTKLVDQTAAKTYTGSTVKVLAKDLQTATNWKGSGTAAAYSATVSGVTLVSGHHYAIYAVILFSVQTTVPQGSTAGSTVSATLDLASGGRGAVLTGIQVA